MHRAKTGVVTLIQRFRSAANLNIHLLCLFLDRVYRITDAGPVFQSVCAPITEQLHTLLNQIKKRIMKLLTRTGFLIEEEGMTFYMDETYTTVNVMSPLARHHKILHIHWKSHCQSENPFSFMYIADEERKCLFFLFS